MDTSRLSCSKVLEKVLLHFFFVPLNEVVILDTLDLGHKES